MTALASAGVVHGDVVLRFEQRASSGDDAGYFEYVTGADSVTEDRPAPPTIIYQRGLRWQLVPRRLYRREDRRDYLLASYPNAAGAIGAVDIPSIEAVGIFECTTDALGAEDNARHLCELVIDLAQAIATGQADFALAFFLEDAVWMVLYRGGKLILAQGRPYADEPDAVFTIAALLHQYGLDRASTPLYAGGGLTAESQLWRALEIYFDVHALAQGSADLQLDAPACLLLAYGRALRRGFTEASTVPS